jgi:hypothetical protein
MPFSQMLRTYWIGTLWIGTLWMGGELGACIARNYADWLAAGCVGGVATSASWVEFSPAGCCAEGTGGRLTGALALFSS